MTIVSRDGASTHRLLVRMYDGGQFEAGDLVRYDGPPNWKLEPLDADRRAEWAKSVARPEHVMRENLRTGAILRMPPSAAELAEEKRIRGLAGVPARIEF